VEEIQENPKEMKALICSFIVAFALILASCSTAPVYEKSYDFQDNNWSQKVKPSFTVDIKDTSKAYDFVITLRTTTEYKFSNLWIYLNSATPDGHKVREPYEIKLTKPDGSWIGKKTGTIVENSLYFRNRKMPKGGKYVFVIEQGITQSLIDEVIDIGLRVEEATVSGS
jgi:gliding motility-associated lipoprotein GldH